MSQEHITIAAGRYSSLALNASKEPVLCKTDDGKLRATRPRGPGLRGPLLRFSQGHASALQPPGVASSPLPWEGDPASAPLLQVVWPRRRTGGCSGAPDAATPAAPAHLPGPQPPPPAGSSAEWRPFPAPAGPAVAPCPPRGHLRPGRPHLGQASLSLLAGAPRPGGSLAQRPGRGPGWGWGGRPSRSPSPPRFCRAPRPRVRSLTSGPPHGASAELLRVGRGRAASTGRGALVPHYAGGGTREGT